MRNRSIQFRKKILSRQQRGSERQEASGSRTDASNARGGCYATLAFELEAETSTGAGFCCFPYAAACSSEVIWSSR
jgi:hypothetical protein